MQNVFTAAQIEAANYNQLRAFAKEVGLSLKNPSKDLLVTELLKLVPKTPKAAPTEKTAGIPLNSVPVGGKFAYPTGKTEYTLTDRNADTGAVKMVSTAGVEWPVHSEAELVRLVIAKS